MTYEVLIAEDNAGDVSLLEIACEEHRLPVRLRVAGDGREARDLLVDRATGSAFALIILDLNLPIVSGFDLLTIVRGDPELARIPTVVITSSTREADRRRCFALGADDYLVKPSDLDEYDTIVERLRALLLRPRPPLAPAS